MTNTPPQPLTAQHAVMFRIYCGYRVLLGIVLGGILLLTAGNPLVGRQAPALFAWICAGYALAALILLILAPRRRALGVQLIFANLFVDIGVLTALIHLSGGSSSGLTPLLLVDAAVAGLMLGGQLAALVAALGTIALLGDAIYLNVRLGFDQNFLLTGLLGALLFATAAGFHRLRNTQLLAQARGADVSKLQNLNQLIVQRMRTGIIVVDREQRIVMLNQAAAELMEDNTLQALVDRGEQPLLPTPLRERLLRWRDYPAIRQQPFSLSSTGTELVARFTALLRDEPTAAAGAVGDTLIFLEDNLQLAQRAQQLKLAALGRLTASIAHEIRNPLSAVSHAAQLLHESDALNPTDLRLTEIIQNHSQRMNAVIENILQLSRRSPPNPQRLHLGLWLNDFVQQYRQGHPDDCMIDIDVDADTEITVDPDQLGQVLTNLLDNALRYSERATGVAHATLIGTTDREEHARLDVIDDGAGIPRENWDRVFEPFFTTEPSGNGLGLYISRELCEINQARLHYLHDNTVNSCFRINFSHPDRRPLIHE